MPHKGAVVAVIKHFERIARSLRNNHKGQLPNRQSLTSTRIEFKTDNTNLQKLTAAALVLPGLFVPLAQAAEGDEVDFQYGHYQEGNRDISTLVLDPISGSPVAVDAKSSNPIEAETLRGSAKVSLTDRIKFAFNYTQDTWGGATPISSAPALFGGNQGITKISPSGDEVLVGASPYIQTPQGMGFIDRNNKFYGMDPDTGEPLSISDNRISHTLSTASPETRKQGDFKLSYEWDDLALSVGAGYR